MYDWPEVREATTQWWAGLARHLGVMVPLSRPEDHEAAWLRPDLLFSQTCGYPYVHSLAGLVELVATPHYDVDGCEGPFYRSILYARTAAPLEHFRARTAAVNAPNSMSGMLALKLAFAPLAEDGKFFGGSVTTGSHEASLTAVRDGRADVCAIDAVCAALARRHRPELMAGLVEIGRTPAVPGLPYITRAGDAAALRRALRLAFADHSLAPARRQLFLAGFSERAGSDYEVILEHERALERAGGLSLI
jgi:ABC-type phosphate/phosphonate transport system substrate-binding protein